MGTEPEIATAVAVFIQARVAERTALKEVEERDLDTKIAARNHDQFEIERAAATLNAARQDWYQCHKALKDAANAIPRTLGLTAEQVAALKSALS